MGGKSEDFDHLATSLHPEKARAGALLDQAYAESKFEGGIYYLAWAQVCALAEMRKEQDRQGKILEKLEQQGQAAEMEAMMRAREKLDAAMGRKASGSEVSALAQAGLRNVQADSEEGKALHGLLCEGIPGKRARASAREMYLALEGLDMLEEAFGPVAAQKRGPKM